MALDLTTENRELGRTNFQQTTNDLTRRGFMKGLAAATAAGTLAAGGAYFGYKSISGKPVKAALIGCGDEGGVLLGEHNPDYIQFVAACDIRPFNKKRILEGDPKVALRKGFTKIYGADYTKKIEASFETDYRKILANPEIEAVVIALPLHLHAKVTIEALEAKKHVLCEKLMARTIKQCKEMIAAAKKNNRILSIGHQRHYSLLYAHATEVLKANVIGDIKHIRALWHRNFSWNWTADPREPEVVSDKSIIQPFYRDGWTPPIYKMDYDELKDKVKGDLNDPQYGYRNLYELLRWRLYQRTGGGLMAELGSHQLDAASIFLGKVHPLSVQGVGHRSFFGAPNATPFRNNRSIDDHVFVTYEFPGKNHPKGPNKGSDPSDVVVVTYSSVSTNGFEQYGECVMGSRGTLIVEGEQQVMLYKEREPAGPAADKGPKATNVSVTSVGSSAPTLAASSTWGGPPPSAAGSTPAAGGVTPVSRGYREEMEDFAYCIRMWDEKIGYAKLGAGESGPAGRHPDKFGYKQALPRCHGEVAMADAILALSANLSMMHDGKKIKFEESWFDGDKMDAVPDAEINPDKIED
jgi:predicted dehydrogenase